MDLTVDLFRREVEEFFASMDRDFDGHLTFEELMGEETTLEKLFKNMDQNGDGLVTQQVHTQPIQGSVESKFPGTFFIIQQFYSIIFIHNVVIQHIYHI